MTRIIRIVVVVAGIEDVVRGHIRSEIPLIGWKAIAVPVIYCIVDQSSLHYLGVK